MTWPVDALPAVPEDAESLHRPIGAERREQQADAVGHARGGERVFAVAVRECVGGDRVEAVRISEVTVEKRDGRRVVWLRVAWDQAPRLVEVRPDSGQAIVGNRNTQVHMLSWSVFFLIIALAAALLGFSSLAGAAAGIAKTLFGVFLVLFVISLFFGRRIV